MDSFEKPLKIAELMRGFKNPWFVAGGWAIDLYLGQVSRHHKDLEITILRRDQLALQNYLSGWNFKKAIPNTSGPMVPWNQGEWLELPVHEIHARKAGDEASAFEILLNESSGAMWEFRRNRMIVRPLSMLGMHTEDRVPFLRPEIVLLYKAKNPTIDDEADFHAARGRLGSECRQWLKQAILTCHPGHHWLASL